MLIKGPVFKLILGSLVTLGIIAAAGAAYMLYIKPYAPTNLYVTISNNGGTSQEDCEPVVHFIDMSQNEEEFRVYRRNLGASTYALIQGLPPLPGRLDQTVYTDSPLPLGTYEYKVSSYNKFGESFSYSVQVTVVYSNTCIKVPVVDPNTLPVNPVIVSLSIINDCSVRISYLDNSTNEQGLKILRDETYGDPTFILLKTLGPHAGISGTYDDNTRLPAGKYGYRIVAYNQNGDSASGYTTIDVTSVCAPGVKFAPTVDALAFPTAQKLSTEPCIWQASTDVFLRKGPNIGTYARLVDEKSGAILPIIGQSEDGQFWAVEVSPGVIGYITKAEIYSRTNGDCSSVPTLKDPPPAIEAAPMENSSGNNNENPTSVPATPCPVGAVCP